MKNEKLNIFIKKKIGPESKVTGIKWDMSLYLTLFNFILMYVPLNLALSPHRLFVVIYTFVVPIIEEATIKFSAQKWKQNYYYKLSEKLKACF